MQSLSILRAVGAASLLALTSCQTQEQLRLPQGYSSEFSTRDLVLVCSFDNEIPEAGLPEVAADLSTFLQAELGRINRFTVYCLWGDGTYRLARELDAQNLISVPEVEEPTRVDLYLNATVTATHGANIVPSGNRAFSYLVDAAVQLQSSERIQLWARNFEGARVRRTSILDTGGEWIGGHNPDSNDDVMHALKESSRVLLNRVVTQLGYEYPVTGAVTGASGGRVAFDRGAKHGVMGEVRIVVWDKQPGGIDVPLGDGPAVAAHDRTSFEVERWYTKDPAAAATIEALHADPTWISTHPGRLFATTYGLGTPPEWDEASRQAERMKKYE
ncbi:MAG: hypothetical protein AAF682_14925 [Planctomycetota bacterium]